MHESEKWKWSRSVESDPQWPHGLQPTRLLCPWDLPGRSTRVGCHCLLRSSGLQTSNLLHRSLLGYLSYLKFNSSKNELLPPHHHHNSKSAVSSFRKWQLNWSSQNLRIILNASIFNVLHTHTISKSYNLWFQNISSIWHIPVSFQILFWPKLPPSLT